MRWEQLVPNLPVPDVGAAQHWYSDVLGLGVNWTWEDNFGSVGAENVELFLYEGEDPTQAVCSVFVEAVYARGREHGSEIVSPLELKPWGVREFTVRDPGGNTLRIGRGEEQVDHLDQFSLGTAE